MVKINSVDVCGYLTKYVDPAPILKELQDNKIITEQESKDLQAVQASLLFEKLLCLLTKKRVDIDRLLCIMHKTKNQDLKRLFTLLTADSTVPRVNRAKHGIKSEVRTYFNDLKAKFLNATFKDPLDVFQKESRNIEHSLSLLQNGDLDRKLVIVDKQISMIANVLDASIMTFRPAESVSEMFKLLTQLVPHSSNTALSDAILFSRMALMKDLRVYDKKFSTTCQDVVTYQDGADMLRRAHECANNITPCLELANVYFIHLLHELWRFEQSPTIAIKESLLSLGRFAIQCLEKENIHVQTLWKRLVYIKTAFCLLGISNNLIIINGFEPTAEDVYQAREYLGLFDECRQHMPMVRKLELYYCFARARQYALSGEVTTSFFFAKEVSRLLGNSHTFRETETILSYCQRIEVLHERELQYQSQLSLEDDQSSTHSSVAMPVEEVNSIMSESHTQITNYDTNGSVLHLCEHCAIKYSNHSNGEETLPKYIDFMLEDSKLPLWSMNTTLSKCCLCDRRVSNCWQRGLSTQESKVVTCDIEVIFGSGYSKDEETLPKRKYSFDSVSYSCGYQPLHMVRGQPDGASIIC